MKMSKEQIAVIISIGIGAVIMLWWYKHNPQPQTTTSNIAPITTNPVSTAPIYVGGSGGVQIGGPCCSPQSASGLVSPSENYPQQMTDFLNQVQ